MSTVSLVIAASSYIICSVTIIWICYQCKRFVLNHEFQQHQAFLIRGKWCFISTAVILILNLIFRPVLFSFAAIKLIELTAIWRLIIDIFQMSLYAIVEFRCWSTYYALLWSTAKVDKQWKRHMNESYNDDCFIRYHNIFANQIVAGSFLTIHGIICVSTCSIVEELFGFGSEKLITHFIVANIILFLITIYRLCTIVAPSLKHTYSHDMLGVNAELNTITFIMTLTAICDGGLSLFAPKKAVLFYIVYQTILISLLGVIIFYYPYKRIQHLMNMENSMKLNDNSDPIRLKFIFADTDLYHSLMRFMIQEFNVENLLFVTQWFQIQKIIFDSGIDIKIDQTAIINCNVMINDLISIPSDIFTHSNNILEASRALYDKFVNTHDIGSILAINISSAARKKLNEFYKKHHEFPSNSESQTELSASGHEISPNLNNIRNYNLFVKQLKENKIEVDVIEEMMNCYKGCVRDCWYNMYDSFRRFQCTLEFKINASYSDINTPNTVRS